MFTKPQVQYLEDVLGVAVNHFTGRAAAAAAGAAAVQPAARLLVLSRPLALDESQLMAKILASVHLAEYSHIESLNLPADISPSQVLIFGGDLPVGRHESGAVVWWSLPALNDMIGAGPSVIEKKKLTWSLLQQLAKERVT